ncbi:hypothetical protein QVD99_006942 [Batrachochytrium dendrobatidis]|nr:hypothetical protein QVD99_006942 [Batrachochytrium dendrobatidis]
MEPSKQEHTVTSLLSMLSTISVPTQSQPSPPSQPQSNTVDLGLGAFTPNMVEDVRRTFLYQQFQQPQLYSTQGQASNQHLNLPGLDSFFQQFGQQPAQQDQPGQSYQNGYSNQHQNGSEKYPPYSKFQDLVNDLRYKQSETERALLEERAKYIEMQENKRRELDAQEIIGKITEKEIKDKEAIFVQELRKFDAGVFRRMEETRRKQQALMQQAGMPGFEVTDDPSKITSQIWCLAPFLLAESHRPSW